MPQFNEQVECRDASIFMSIPALLVMETLTKLMNSSEKTLWQNLCTRFKASIIESDDWKQTQEQFDSLRGAKTLLQSLKL